MAFRSGARRATGQSAGSTCPLNPLTEESIVRLELYPSPAEDRLEQVRMRAFFPSFAFLLACLVLLLSGCTLPNRAAVTPLRTEELPTLVALTVAARGQTQTPPASPSPSRTSELPDSMLTDQSPPAFATQELRTPTLRPTKPPATPTLAPATATRTPTQTPTVLIPDAAIQIRSPGALSRLVSPFDVRAYVKPGSDGRVRLELIGEDGRLLVRKVLAYSTALSRVNLNEKIEFEINAVAEAARLQISTFDQFGRPLALNSVDVVLLSMGEADINPPGPTEEKIIVLEPLPNKLIQGGVLSVSGLARSDGQQPLLVELLRADGKVVGYRLAAVHADPAGGYGDFIVEVPYQVEEPTWVRMVIKENSSSRLGGASYLTSLELLLSP